MKPVIPETNPEFDHTRIIERPDGFYWQDRDTGEEYGPFPTLLEAVEDMGYSEEGDFGEDDGGIAEAEDDLGVSDWVDPETGGHVE